MAQVFVSCECVAPACGNGHTAASTAFSQTMSNVPVRRRSQPGPNHRDGAQDAAHRECFRTHRHGVSEFNVIHHIATDSKGNLYATELNPGTRVRKFTFTALWSP